MPGPLTEKLEVVRVGMDLSTINLDKFKAILYYEDKPYGFHGFCIASEDKVMFYDPLRGLYANHKVSAFANFAKHNPDKNLRQWLQTLLITGDYGCDMYMGYSDDYFKQLGDEIKVTHILD